MNDPIVWRHGPAFRIRRVTTGDQPRLVTYRITMSGRFVDSALSLQVARRLCERHGRRFLAGRGRHV